MKKLNIVTVVLFEILLLLFCKKIVKDSINNIFKGIRKILKAIVNKYFSFIKIIHLTFTEETITNILIVFMVAVFKKGLGSLYDSFKILIGEHPYFEFLFTSTGIGLSCLIFIILMFSIMPNPYGKQKPKEKFKDYLLIGIFKFLISALVATLAYELDSTIASIITVVIFDGFKRMVDGKANEYTQKDSEKENEVFNKINNIKSPFEKN